MGTFPRDHIDNAAARTTFIMLSKQVDMSILPNFVRLFHSGVNDRQFGKLECTGIKVTRQERSG